MISKNICNLDFYLNGCSSHEEIKVCPFFTFFIDDQTHTIHNQHKSDHELDSYFNNNFTNTHLLPLKKESHEKKSNHQKKVISEKKISRDSSN